MATQNSTLTQDQVKSLFDYKDGNLYYKERVGKMLAGQKAGSIRPSGYIAIVINQKPYYAHRLIYMMFHQNLPKYIDHINGAKADNRIENLRKATKQQNQWNVTKLSTNTSGYKNVTWSKRERKWYVRIRINEKNKSFGAYFDLEVAKFVAETMRHKYHKNFANHK
jgi:hypothetical protein